MGIPKVLRPLAFFLGFSLWVDRTPGIPGAYVAPLSVLVASFSLPLLLPWLLRLKLRLDLVLALLLGLWLAAGGALGVIWDGYANPFLPLEVRLAAYVRQLLPLAGGLLLFLTVRTWFAPSGASRAFLLGVLAGGLLSVGIGLLQQAGFPLEERFREFLGFPFFPGRTAGLAAEPAHFATLLVLLGIPVGLILAFQERGFNRFLGILFLLLCGPALFFSKSTVGLFLLGFFVLGFIVASLLLGGRWASLSMFLTISLLALGVFLLREAYPRAQLEALLSGEPTVSFYDRFFGLLGGFYAWFNEPRALLGYGLGGHGYRLEVILPQEVALQVLEVKDESFPALNSLMGRVAADGGMVGFALLFALVIYGFRQAGLLAAHFGPVGLILFSAWSATVAAVALGGQGSLAAPPFWFWLAVLSAWRNERCGC